MSFIPAGVRGILANRDYRRYATGRFLATIAWQMLGVAVGWQVYSITHDPLDLGLVGLAQFLPFLACVLPGGQLADRADRRAVMIAAYVVESGCAAVLVAFTMSGSREIWPVFLAMALFGAGRAVWMPASQAMTVNLVAPEQFPTAVGFNSTLFQTAVVAGPALGGLLYAFGETVLHIQGALLVYSIALVLLLIVIVLYLGIRPVRAPPSSTPLSVHEFFEGVRFVLRNKPVLGAITLDLFAVLFGGAVALLPVYARDILQIGPIGLGTLRSAPGLGAATMAAWLAAAPIRQHAGRWMFGGVAVFGFTTMIFGLSRSFTLSLVALYVCGAGDMVSVFVRHLLVQLETPDAIRGRVSAVSAMFIGASNELGEFESGVTARVFGTVPSVVFGGLACLGVVGVYLWLFPSLRTLDRFARREA
jgi:MFS family permease